MSMAAVAGSRHRGRSRALERLLGRQPAGLAFSAPYVIFLVVIFAYPMGLALWISFHDYRFMAPGARTDFRFVGLINYVTALSDPAVLRSFVNTFVFLIINVPLTVSLALLLAVGLNRLSRWTGGFRVLFYLPYVTASVSLIGVWLLLFSRDGLVNTVLGPLAPDPSWLVNSGLAMPSVAFYVTWKQLGFYVLVYLAALQGISGSLYEAAALDGAGFFATLRAVTVPGVRNATVLVVILALITGANLFTEPYLLTSGGGPNGASSSPVLLIYQRGLQQTNPDVASAIGVVLVIIIGLLSLAANRIVAREGD